MLTKWGRYLAIGMTSAALLGCQNLIPSSQNLAPTQLPMTATVQATTLPVVPTTTQTSTPVEPTSTPSATEDPLGEFRSTYAENSPDGQWRVTSDGYANGYRLRVVNEALNKVWVQTGPGDDLWQWPAGWGPRQFVWSTDGQFLYYWTQVPLPSEAAPGCPSDPYEEPIRQLDLKTGSVKVLALTPTPGHVRITTPDRQSRALWIEADQPQPTAAVFDFVSATWTTVELPVEVAGSWDVGPLVWSPSGRYLATPIQPGDCSGDRRPEDQGSLGVVVVDLKDMNAWLIPHSTTWGPSLAWRSDHVLEVDGIPYPGSYWIDAITGTEIDWPGPQRIAPPDAASQTALRVIQTAGLGYQLTTVSAVGGSTQSELMDPILPSPLDNFQPWSWSSDGRWLAGGWKSPSTIGDISAFALEMDTGRAIDVADRTGMIFNQVRWSRTGDALVFAGYRFIDILDIFSATFDHETGRAGALIQLTTTTDRDEREPAWSPNGDRIAFTSTRRVVGAQPVLAIMDREGTQRQEVYTDGQGVFTPVWSPDGTRIAYSTDPDHGVIQVYNLVTGTLIQVSGGLAHAPGDVDLDPAWSPDGRYVAYRAFRNGSLEIQVALADGSGWWNALPCEEYCWPGIEWRP